MFKIYQSIEKYLITLRQFTSLYVEEDTIFFNHSHCPNDRLGKFLLLRGLPIATKGTLNNPNINIKTLTTVGLD